MSCDGVVSARIERYLSIWARPLWVQDNQRSIPTFQFIHTVHAYDQNHHCAHSVFPPNQSPLNFVTCELHYWFLNINITELPDPCTSDNTPFKWQLFSIECDDSYKPVAPPTFRTWEEKAVSCSVRSSDEGGMQTEKPHLPDCLLPYRLGDQDWGNPPEKQALKL